MFYEKVNLISSSNSSNFISSAPTAATISINSSSRLHNFLILI